MLVLTNPFSTPPRSARRITTPCRSSPPPPRLGRGERGGRSRCRRCTARIRFIRCGGGTAAPRMTLGRTGMYRGQARTTGNGRNEGGDAFERLRAPAIALATLATAARLRFATHVRLGLRARRRRRSRAPPSCCRHSRSQSPRGRDAARRRSPHSSPWRHSRSRRSAGDHARATLLTAPPARLLFFARMQAGGRMGVPPDLARDCAEAGARWVSSGGAGAQAIGPTQEDMREKNARPIVRF
ncbi:hypothetical protein B0H17DRAFT_676314 [Mycena rosella]|uniref:Uncharacterized protein n=1 Tax=Mycena rosella TaxID=1033263 RepID=A0AAD7DC77_MYCRO|nr:hypothetical protein B0H17DRAFT_676314 [Mycena rosella]